MLVGLDGLSGVSAASRVATKASDSDIVYVKTKKLDTEKRLVSVAKKIIPNGSKKLNVG